MKKWYLLFFLLMVAMAGCNNGSSSGGGGGGGEFNMNGNWSGQWAAIGEVYVLDPNVHPGDPDYPKYVTKTQSLGGPLSATLQLNGRQLTGTITAVTILGNQPAQFSATISNPGGSGNIEVGTAFVGPYSISFHAWLYSLRAFSIAALFNCSAPAATSPSIGDSSIAFT